MRTLRMLIVTIAMSSIMAVSAKVNEKPFVVPELTSWTGAEGSVTLSGRIVVKNGAMRQVAQALAADYEQMFGKKLTVVSGKMRRGDVVIGKSKIVSLGDEGYRMDISNSIGIEATTPRGAYWATRTLLQMSEQNDDRKLPCGVIEDVPQYALRGFMIDCGRKFIPMSYLRNLVKVMAYYKMNTLQIHLNDNGFRQFFDGDWMKTQAAFRLESETYPGLAAADGHYTKQEFVDLQILAEQCSVDIIPEIDSPAHVLAFTQFKPELGSKECGMDHFDLFNDEVYKFMDALFAEYLAGPKPVFRGKRVHIGTDEYSNKKQEVVEKFRAYTDHYIRYVESFGKQAVLWGALTHANGTTAVKNEGVIMDCWYNGYADPRKMKELGYQLISIPDGLVYIVPAAGYYYDYLNCKYLYNEWTPAVIGRERFEENDPAIEGGMFAVWNDHVGNGITVKDIHHRVFPAMQTLAVKCWTGKYTSLSWDEFDRLRLTLSEAPGVNELGRLGAKGETVIVKDVLNPGEQLDAEEIGYNYAVSFKITGETEAPGTELLRSNHAVVYLADPKTGKLAFEREGYLNTFEYRIEKGKTASITIMGDNRGTQLWVDGKLKETLGAKPLYVMREQDRAHYQVEGNKTAAPIVYDPKPKINYQRTLVFPLRQAGDFRSRITDFKVTVQ
ncbi:MAG: family 20 glycosylhydrolase [Muribaculaceae bacterium]